MQYTILAGDYERDGALVAGVGRAHRARSSILASLRGPTRSPGVWAKQGPMDGLG